MCSPAPWGCGTPARTLSENFRNTPKLNIYKLSQDKNTGWDTYSDCVVVAETEEAARMVNPSQLAMDPDYAWVAPEFVKVQYLGVARDGLEAGVVVVSSFHAG